MSTRCLVPARRLIASPRAHAGVAGPSDFSSAETTISYPSGRSTVKSVNRFVISRTAKVFRRRLDPSPVNGRTPSRPWKNAKPVCACSALAQTRKAMVLYRKLKSIEGSNIMKYRVLSIIGREPGLYTVDRRQECSQLCGHAHGFNPFNLSQYNRHKIYTLLPNRRGYCEKSVGYAHLRRVARRRYRSVIRRASGDIGERSAAT